MIKVFLGYRETDIIVAVVKQRMRDERHDFLNAQRSRCTGRLSPCKLVVRFSTSIKSGFRERDHHASGLILLLKAYLELTKITMLKAKRLTRVTIATRI